VEEKSRESFSIKEGGSMIIGRIAMMCQVEEKSRESFSIKEV